MFKPRSIRQEFLQNVDQRKCLRYSATPGHTREVIVRSWHFLLVDTPSYSALIGRTGGRWQYKLATYKAEEIAIYFSEERE
jgi:GTP-binding protein EngB required for normal cell division